jgi:ribosomal protein S27AE
MPTRRLSSYALGKRFMLAVLTAMFLIMWIIPLGLSAIGMPTDWTTHWIVLPLGMLWVLAGGIGSFLIRCPNCGKSLFMRGMFSVPWPERHCSKCGEDLTVATR